MAIHDLRKKTNASSGQKIMSFNNNNNRVEQLENKINKQEQKLDKIIELLQNGNNLPDTNKQSS